MRGHGRPHTAQRRDVHDEARAVVRDVTRVQAQPSARGIHVDHEVVTGPEARADQREDAAVRGRRRGLQRIHGNHGGCTPTAAGRARAAIAADAAHGRRAGAPAATAR